MTTYTGGWAEFPRWGGLVTDVGVYAGPWPLPVPIIDNLPLDAVEVDYVVCLPNPDGVAADAFDESYPTVMRNTFLFWAAVAGGPTEVRDSGLLATGGAAAVDALPVGAHLFVFWFDAHTVSSDVVQPSKVALEIVPAGWAPGASGAGGSGPVSIALPVSEFTFTAFAPNPPRTGVVIALPPSQTAVRTPALYVGNDPGPLDSPVVNLYQRNGVTPVARLRNARAVSWSPEVSRTGSATFEVPLDDATTDLIVDKRIVKLAWLRDGVVVQRFACRIDSETATLAIDEEDRRWLRFENQPGVLALMGEAVVRPEYNLANNRDGSREFGYMSAAGTWKIDSEWVTPRGRAWSDLTGGIRQKRPPDFRTADPTAQWISLIDPNTTQPEFAANYFRCLFTLAEQIDVEILAASDNGMNFYLDGEPIFEWVKPNPFTWREAQTTTLRLAAGDHLIAVQVNNAAKAAGERNPIALIATLIKLDNKGKRDGVIVHTDTDNWIVHASTPEPGWHRAEVLRKLFHEADDRSVRGVGVLQLGYTATHDSTAAAWGDRGQYLLDVATVTLLDVIEQLTEAEMDVGVDPVTMHLHAWRRQGRDRSSSVEFTLGEGGNLTSYEVGVEGIKFTSVLTQLANGDWVVYRDEDAVDDIGVIEVGLSLASTTTSATAGSVARQQLAEASAPLKSIQMEISPGGPLFGRDFDLGDTVRVPGERNVGTMKVRVMKGLIDLTGEVVRQVVEVVEDRS